MTLAYIRGRPFLRQLADAPGLDGDQAPCGANQQEPMSVEPLGNAGAELRSVYIYSLATHPGGCGFQSRRNPCRSCRVSQRLGLIGQMQK